MKHIKVGLTVAPNMPEKLTNKFIDILPELLEKRISGVSFEFKVESNTVVGSAEYVDRCIDYAYKRKEKSELDYSICVTDLPSFSNNKSVISDVNFEKQTALISLPALGIYRLKRKLRSTIMDVIIDMYMNSEHKTSPLKKLSSIKVNEVTPQEKTTTNHRYVYSSTILGVLKIILGMTYANEPWKAIISFKKIIALGVATGTYISIFSTPWQLSLVYEWQRFILLMTLSLIGMIGWLVYAHNFWEFPSSATEKKYRYLYNITTLLTMFCLFLLSYIILFLLLLTSIIFFVPDDLFKNWGNATESYSVSNYLRLSWFISSAGLLAGALGSVMEGENTMKEITYTSRQRGRKQRIQRQLEKEETSLKTEKQKKTHKTKT